MYHLTDLTFSEELDSRDATRYIVLMCSLDTARHTVEQVHQVHKKRGMAGIAYHYFIDKEGEIFVGRPLHTKGAFLEAYNSNAIGVCFEGDFNKEKMRDEQVTACILLLSVLSLAYRDVELRDYWQCKGLKAPSEEKFPFTTIELQVGDCKAYLQSVFGEPYNDDDYFVPNYEWRTFHDHLGDEEEEAHRHNAPAYPIHFGNFNYFKLLDFIDSGEIVEDYYWEKDPL